MQARVLFSVRRKVRAASLMQRTFRRHLDVREAKAITSRLRAAALVRTNQVISIQKIMRGFMG
jgi:hypothetical protein